MLVSLLTAVILVSASFFFHFAAMKSLAGLVHRDDSHVRRPLLLVIFALFITHLVEVVLYAGAMSWLDWLGLGHLSGMEGNGWEWIIDHFYFSIAAYTTLGLGDIVPHGQIRLIAGVEALNGLVLIAWSASFTYLMMERLWGNDSGSAQPRTRAGKDDDQPGND
jgi:Ion channel